jgi:hypothetical protein
MANKLTESQLQKLDEGHQRAYRKQKVMTDEGNERVRIEAHNRICVAVDGLVEENRKLREERRGLQITIHDRDMVIENMHVANQVLVEKNGELLKQTREVIFDRTENVELRELRATNDRLQRDKESLTATNTLNLAGLKEGGELNEKLTTALSVFKETNKTLVAANERLEQENKRQYDRLQSFRSGRDDDATKAVERKNRHLHQVNDNVGAENRLLFSKNEKLILERDGVVAKNEQLQRDLDTCVGLQGVIRELSNEKRDLITANKDLSLKLKETAFKLSNVNIRNNQLKSRIHDLYEIAKKATE